METRPEGIYRSFNAAKDRLEILRRLVTEFAGVTLEETPIPGDFQSHVKLTFISTEQSEAFMTRMIKVHRQESNSPS